MMKHLPLILRHLTHNWIRTSSTVLAMAACIFLFCTLETVIEMINFGLKSASANRLITRHNVSLTFSMPTFYKEKIAGVPGVKTVVSYCWFGGVYQDRKNFFANFAVEPKEYFAIYPEYIIAPDQMKEFLGDLRACVIGQELATRFNWKIGDTIPLESFIPRYRKGSPFEFVVKAIYRADQVRFPGTSGQLFFFHFKYLYEGTSQQSQVGAFATEIEDPSKALEVSKAVDAVFENSDTPTKTETEAAFRASFISLGGNLAYLLHAIGLAVTFTILLVTANTMGMAVRERRTEIGILKTLGFSNLRVLAIILTEAALLGALGGALGVTLGQGMIRILPSIPLIGEIVKGFPRLGISLPVAGMGFAMALALGFAAGLAPAVLSYRARVTQLLRQV